MKQWKALLFDCDGVLAETERDGHRVAYNRAMKELGIDGYWDLDEYERLVRVFGGKERLRSYFGQDSAKYPPDHYNDELIRQIYERKVRIFNQLIEDGELPGRSGVRRLVHAAHEAGLLTFVCTASHKSSVSLLLTHDFGRECLAEFTELFCGDIVTRKKPAPDIYMLAAERYRLDPADCLVIEDSGNGLLAARGAGRHCLITPSFYSCGEDFSQADAIVSALGDPGGEESEFLRTPVSAGDRKYVDLSYLKELVER